MPTNHLGIRNVQLEASVIECFMLSFISDRLAARWFEGELNENRDLMWTKIRWITEDCLSMVAT